MRFLVLISAFAMTFTGAAALAQDKNPFADPQNLKVLPKDIDPERLRAIMRGIAMATGIRCSGCHVKAEGKPLFEWDFSLDEKPKKHVARDMLRMVGEINKSIGKIEDLKDRDKPTVRVRCVTCHRGVERPEMIQDILDTYKDEQDGEGAVAHYRELREVYYGSHAYDFTAFTLGNYALERSQEGLHSFASALHALNRELNPDNANVYLFQGQSLMAAQKFEEAAATFREALELDPENQFIKGLLAQAERALKEKSGEE